MARLRPRARRERVGDRRGVVGDVDDRHDRRAEALHLGPDARLEPLARRAVDRLLDEHADPAGTERGDPDTTGPPAPSDRFAAPRSPRSATRCGATLTLATRSPARTIWPS